MTDLPTMTPEQVAEVKRLYFIERWSQGRICRHFGRSINTIGRIVRGETWKSVPTPMRLDMNADLAKASEESARRVQEMLKNIRERPALPDMLKPKKPNPYE